MIKYKIKSMIVAQKSATVLMPVIQESLAFRRAYLAELRRMLHRIAKSIRTTIMPSYQSELITDARESDFEALRNTVKGLLLGTSETVKQLIALEGMKHTEKFAAAARDTFKIDLQGVIEAEDLQTYLDRAALRNAGLITGMTDDLIKKVQTITTNSLISGDAVGMLRKKLKKEFGISDNRAQLIARDQTSKLNADMNKVRHLQAGVTGYIWRTSRDERVRARHARIDNVEYEYGDETGAEDGLEPGQPIRCRCIAQGIVKFGGEDFTGRSPIPEQPGMKVIIPPTGAPVKIPSLPPIGTSIVGSKVTEVKAKKRVIARGKGDGNEHLIIIHKKSGNVISDNTSGEVSHVGLDDAGIKAIFKNKSPIIAHHNHPSNGSFSLADLMMVTGDNSLHELFAHGHKGSSFKAIFKPGRKIGRLTERSFGISTAKTAAKLTDLINQSIITRAEANLVYSHMVSIRLSKLGYFKYEHSLNSVATKIMGKINDVN